MRPSRTATSTFVVPPIASVAVGPSAGLSVGVGSGGHVFVDARSASGAPLAGCRGVTWTSSDTTIARVTATGDVTGVATGSATITAAVGGQSASVAVTVGVGEVSSEARRLMETTERSLWAGIEAARVGNRLGDISSAIGACADSYGIVRGYGGHGVGRQMHMEPHISNYGRPGTGLKLQAGMVLALEPMFALGDPETEETSDGWTVVMCDGRLSAHFEETVAITGDGPEVLTRIA